MTSSVKRVPLRRWEHRYLGEERFPEMLSALEIEYFFTLDEQGLVQVRDRRSPVNRMALALRLLADDRFEALITETVAFEDLPSTMARLDHGAPGLAVRVDYGG